MPYAKSASIAEEIAQDAWVAAIAALDTFEGRSTFRTWIARIAINRAKTLAVRDGRNVPFDEGSAEPAVDPKNFNAIDLWNHWPDQWESPEALAMRREIREAIERGLESLPAAQRMVVTLRDLHSWTSEEVCNALDLSESNQRVLLHRGRSRLRAVLEDVLKEKQK
jgi:RNA polymerase sigma-70 factor (ECF subfamily)